MTTQKGNRMDPYDRTDLATLTPAEQAHLLAVTAEVITTTLTGGTIAATVDPTLAGLVVDGCFASLHAGRELRACCGRIGPGQSLGPTLIAAAQVACRDTRFRPLTPEELDPLTLEVSLLFAWRTETFAAARRPECIQVGTHGLMLRRGHAGGLLLPVVGRDYNWTPEEFLEATCRKAGLPPGAWREDDVGLETFRAMEISGRFDACR